MEIKMCEAVQNGILRFLHGEQDRRQQECSNATTQRRAPRDCPFRSRPTVLSNQQSVLEVHGGTTAGTTFDYKVTVTSVTNIPIDLNSFADRTTNGIGIRVLLHGKSMAARHRKNVRGCDRCR